MFYGADAILFVSDICRFTFNVTNAKEVKQVSKFIVIFYSIVLISYGSWCISQSRGPRLLRSCRIIVSNFFEVFFFSVFKKKTHIKRVNCWSCFLFNNISWRQ